MRNFTFLLLTFLTFNSFSQDTTAFNLIGVNTGGGLDYFYNDSTSMGSLDLSTNFEGGYALFQHPTTGVLYSILYDGANNEGDRNLYSVNPLSGTFSLVSDLSNDYVNTADIGAGGVIYYTTGNGNLTNPNTIYKFDLNTDTETFLHNPVLSDSRALEFHPVDSVLYLYEGYTELLVTLNLLNNQVDTLVTTGMNDEIHGAVYDESTNTFIISAYGGEMYITDNSYLNGTLYHDLDNGVTGNNLMDIEMVKFIQGSKSKGYCPGDSVQINALFSGVNYKWFKNGVEIIGAIDTFYYANTPGVFRALMEVTMNEQVNYIWSEEITVTQSTVPVVTITSSGNDTEICPEESIVLSGANGGSLQWYLNGITIPGANSSSYTATTVGSYNQMKTNTNGCSDTSSVAFVITADANCTSGLSEISANSFQLFPNPTNGDINVFISSNVETSFSIMDLTGKVVQSGDLIFGENKIQLKDLNSGVYLITVNGVTKRIIKK